MIRSRRLGPPRRGRVVDKNYLAWIGTQQCMISGKPATVHHVRFCGSSKNDRRTLPLAPEYHQIQNGPFSIESLGKRKFEARYGVNIEAKIVEYNERYELKRDSSAVERRAHNPVVDGSIPSPAPSLIGVV